MSERIIEADRSIVIAADVPPDVFEAQVRKLVGSSPVEGVGGIKVGFQVGLGLGLRRAVELIKSGVDYPVYRPGKNVATIYDHQKAGTDIPDTGKNFAKAMRDADVEAAILFPFSGPDTEESYIRELQEIGVGVIVGAEMTHPNIAGEKGYVRDDAFQRMFFQAIGLGVRNFVVPGNKPERVAYYRNFFDKEIGEGDFDLFAPGFVAQGGEITEAGKAAGKRWHAIVGRGITQAANVGEAAREHVQQILGQQER